MRAILVDGRIRLDLTAHAGALNLVYLGLGAALFLLSFRSARKRGLILQIGE